ncbi:MAG TPA: CapA family protein [Bacillota bacterium]|nr:CapA family protein [Bacillota bacterium]
MNPDIRRPDHSMQPNQPRKPIFTRPMPAAVPRPSQPMPAASPPRPDAALPGLNRTPPLQSSQRPRFSKKSLLILAITIVVLLAGGAVYAYFAGKRTPSSQQNTQNTNGAATTSPTSIKFIATGDFIAHDSVNAAAKQGDGSYSYLPMMQDFTPLFKDADIKFCNDPILNGGTQFGIAGYPKFNSPTDFVTDMGRLGCNLVNTASNHSFDKNQDAISASVTAWDKVPHMLAVAGQNRSKSEHDAVHVFTVKGVKFAFLAYTAYINNDAPVQNDYGVNVFTKDFAGTQIASAKQQGAQVIIASMRWGTEYSTSVDAEQKADAQWLADQGVSLILGHGSHELQPVQALTGSGGNKTLVWYSLGNFINTQLPPETLFNGIAVMNIDVKTKQVSIAGYLPIYMHYEWTAAQAAAENTNARNNLHLYLLEDATQAMVDKQQLKTTIDAQKTRITNTLIANGLTIPLLTSKQYLAL